MCVVFTKEEDAFIVENLEYADNIRFGCAWIAKQLHKPFNAVYNRWYKVLRPKLKK